MNRNVQALDIDKSPFNLENSTSPKLTFVSAYPTIDRERERIEGDYWISDKSATRYAQNDAQITHFNKPPSTVAHSPQLDKSFNDHILSN